LDLFFIENFFLKLRGNPNESLAKLIFVELNESWSQFEKESKIKNNNKITFQCLISFFW